MPGTCVAEHANEVSSAKRLEMLNKCSELSLTFIRKSKGPSTEPWGTPAFKVPIAAIKNDVCLQNTSKSHSYHLKI